MSLIDYIRPNIFNNPVANSTGMYNPNKKTKPKSSFLLENYPLDTTSSEDIYTQLQNFTPNPSILHGSDTPNLQTEQAGSITNGKYVPPVQTTPFKDNSFMDKQESNILSNWQGQQTQPTVFKQPKTNILGEQVPMQNLDSGVGYVNGKLFNSNKQNTQDMFAGYSKERDAAINSNTGRIDKNSDFYKRNKQAMENLR